MAIILKLKMDWGAVLKNYGGGGRVVRDVRAIVSALHSPKDWLQKCNASSRKASGIPGEDALTQSTNTTFITASGWLDGKRCSGGVGWHLAYQDLLSF